ncbi:MAG: T9SS type A sorting domain-containing protein [Saprospiraceae bacterium]
MASSISNLSAGVYSVTVTDGNGCTVEKSATVEDGVAFFLLPLADVSAGDGDVVDPIALTTNLWGAQFSWTGGVAGGMQDGTATSLNPIIPPFTAVGPSSSSVVVTASLGLCTASDTFELDVTGLLYSVGGNFITENGTGVEEVEVQLEGVGAGITTDLQTESGAEGWYGFMNEVPASTNYTVIPHKDDDPLNGLSTADAIMLQKYLLGQGTLPSPYLLIAADIDHSGTITAKDVRDLRRLLVGLDAQFVNNTSWRFVDRDFVFPNPLNPFETAFPETISAMNIGEDHLEDDFVAIKIGDLNHTASGDGVNLGVSGDRQGGMLYFDAKDRKVEAGEEVLVTLSASERVAGYQFTLELLGMEVEEVQPGRGMSLDNFGVFTGYAGVAGTVLTTSYDGAEAGVFTLKLRAKRSGKLSEMLSLSNRITRSEMYTADATGGLTRGSVALRFNGEVAMGDAFALYQNSPNPFASKTQIGFYLPESSEVTLQVHDEMGRLIYSGTGNYAKGYNQIELTRSEVPASGVMYYTVSTDKASASKKMVVVDK